MLLNRNRAFSGWLRVAAGCLMIGGLAFALAGCGSAATTAAQPVNEAAEPTAAELPSATPTLEPSATPTEAPTATLEPTATATLPPTATPVPPLAVLEDGFSAWCLPESYAGVKPSSPDGPQDANRLSVNGQALEIKIPAVFCTMVYHFNQAVPEGAVLTFFDNNSPFLRLPLEPVADRPDEAWAPVSHTYVVNPPMWNVSYRLAVSGPDGEELWSKVVKFAKPLPEGCPFGGLPDPVTLYCMKTDPWEIEPWPDVTYPYDRSKLPTPED